LQKHDGVTALLDLGQWFGSYTPNSCRICAMQEIDGLGQELP
jgi:hypothetical protein